MEKHLCHINHATCHITINPIYKAQFEELIQQIEHCLHLSNKSNVNVFYWVYRFYDDTLVHAIDVSSESEQYIYNLTITEGDEIYFESEGFTTNECSMRVIDAADVNGFLHCLCTNMINKGAKVNFSFLNNYK